jgi:hypothetical protein
MGQFRQFLNDAQLKECHLEGRLYTWSNERAHPMLEKIDQMFFTNEWEAIFPNHLLHSLVSICSDHAPLTLKMDTRFAWKKHFHFHPFWVRAPSFLDVVASTWHCPLRDASPFKQLDWLFHNTAHVLKSWSDRFLGNVRMQLEIAKEVVHRLEMVHDHRTLAPHEEELRKLLKGKALGLALLQRSIARQEARAHWLSEGDASTRFFHSYTNSRKRRNHIHELEKDGHVFTEEHAKANLIFNYFEDILGTSATRSNTINMQALGLSALNLQELGSGLQKMRY